MSSRDTLILIFFSSTIILELSPSDGLPRRLLRDHPLRLLADILAGRPHRLRHRHRHHGRALRGPQVLQGVPVLEDVQRAAVQERVNATGEERRQRRQPGRAVSIIMYIIHISIELCIARAGSRFARYHYKYAYYRVESHLVPVAASYIHIDIHI